MYFSCKCFCFKQKTIIFATRPEYLYHTKRRKTGDRRADAPSPPIMDRETILPEMTDIREPAMVAYTAVGESRPVAHPPRRTEDVGRAGKRRRSNANNGPHDKPN